MPLPGSLIAFHGGVGIVPSASSEPPDTAAPPDPTEGLSPPSSSDDPAPGGFLDFPGGLGIGPPAGPPPPDPVNTVPTGPPDIIGAPVTVSTSGAIFAYWIARGDLYSQITGGLWTGEAPATVMAMPYAVLTQVSDVLESRTTGPKVFRAMYQVSVMADNLTAADSLCRAVSAAYDEATLALDGFMSCLAGDVRWMPPTKGLGLLGDDCWTCYVELQIMYTR